MKVYEYCLKYMPDYITNSGELNYASLKIFIHEMSLYEKDIVGEIINKEGQQKQREQLDKLNKSDSNKDKGEFFIDYTDPLGCFK